MGDRISKEELKEKMEAKRVVVVDVLSGDSYANKHIKGSRSIPLEELQSEGWKRLDKDSEIVTYCAGYACSLSKKAAGFLKGKGFKAKAYEGGIKEWSESGYPTEGSS